MQKVRNVAQWLRYCAKMGDLVGGSASVDDYVAGGSKRDAVYASAMALPSREEFLGALKADAPRDFAVFGRALRETADVLFPVGRELGYKPAGVVKPFINVPDTALRWKTKYLDNWKGKGRPKSLVLVGPSRTGKTEWARSLGDHIFFGGLFNMDKIGDDVKYAVLDDIDINFFPNYKSWCGGQAEFEVTDKYKGKKTIKWGKPVIWTVNPANDPRDGKSVDRAWLTANCFFVDVLEPMYEKDPEEELEDWEIAAGIVQ